MPYSLEAPRTDREVNGFAYSCIQPFSAGHVLTETEASALNQTFAENIGNILRAWVTKLETPPSAQEFVSTAEETMAEYEFYKRGGRSAMSPVEKEAREIGAAAVSAALAKRGKTATKAAVAEMVDRNWEKYGETWLALAEKAIEARRKAASKDNDDLVIDF